MIYGEYNHCPTRLISGSLLDLPHHQRHMSAIRRMLQHQYPACFRGGTRRCMVVEPEIDRSVASQECLCRRFYMIYGEYNHCPTRLISGSLLDLPHHQRDRPISRKPRMIALMCLWWCGRSNKEPDMRRVGQELLCWMAW
jgi:hypothetical protein